MFDLLALGDLRTMPSSSWRRFGSSGTTMSIGWPTASSVVYPYIRVAASFQERILPSRSLETIASSELCTIAARCCADSSSRRWEMSLAKPAAATIRPTASGTGEIDSDTASNVPSLRRRSVS